MKAIRSVTIDHTCTYCKKTTPFTIGKKPSILKPVIVHLHCGCGVDWVLSVKIFKQKVSGEKTRLDIAMRSNNIPTRPYRSFIDSFPAAPYDGPPPSRISKLAEEAIKRLKV